MHVPRFVLVVVLACSVTAACQPFKPGASTSDVVLWGDSFGEQVAPLLPYEARVFGGTAPCTFLDEIRLRAAAAPPRTAVLLFAGGVATPCTGGTTSGYPRDVAEIMRVLGGRGTRVLVLAAPCLPDGPNPLNAAYQNAGIPLVWGPHNSVCGADGTYIGAYRLGDGGHLNDWGVRRFAHEIRVAVG